MKKQAQDPRDIERINPDNQNTDTNTNTPPDMDHEPVKEPTVKGAVVTKQPTTKEPKKGGKHAA